MKLIILVILTVFSINVFSAEYFDSVLVIKFKSESELHKNWNSSNRAGEISFLKKYIGKHSSKPFITDDLLKSMNRKLNNNMLILNNQKNNFGIERIAIINYESNANPVILSKKISQLDGIEYAEPMYIHKINYKPNDTSYYMQHYIWQTFTHIAWDSMDTTGKPIIIAVVDTGVWYKHPDLEANIYINPDESGLDNNGNDKQTNGIDDDGNGFVDDWLGWDFGGEDNQSLGDNDPRPGHAHGTHVSGIAAAVADNIEGIAGVSFTSKIMPVKIAYDNQFSTSLVNSYKGLLYAATMGADIINCSWGSSGFSQSEQDIINQVVQLGCVIVAAAGNENSNTAFYPAGYDGVLSVAAVYWDDTKATFSNYHHTVDVAAPGTSIYSTIPISSYTAWDGTSMASPVVAGIAAMAKKKRSDYNNLKLIELIKATADNIDSLNTNYKGSLGTGRVNAYKALTDNNPRSISIKNYKITDENDNDVYEANEIIYINFTLKNYLNPINNIKITARNPNIFNLELLTKVVDAGNFKEDEEKYIEKPISFRLPAVLESNYNLQLEIEISDDSGYKIYSLVNLIVNPSYRTISANNIKTTITSQGNIGYNDFPDNSQGQGFAYKNGSNILFEGGLLIGISESKLADVTRGSYSFGNNKEFIFDNIIRSENPGQIAQQELFTGFSTKFDTSSPNIQVVQRVFQFNQAEYSDFIILQYDLINKNDFFIDSLFAGLFFDWDIGPSGADNQAVWDSAMNYGYVWNMQSNELPFAGVAILSNCNNNFFGIDNDGTTVENPGIYDSFTKNEKWMMMTNGIKRKISNSTDASMVISAGPLTMRKSDTTRIIFTIFSGNSKSELDKSFLASKEATEKYLNISGDFVSNPKSAVIQSIYPNPASCDEVAILFGTNNTSQAKLEIYDINGKRITTIFENQSFNSGYYIHKIDISKLAIGNYFVVFSNETNKSIFMLNVQG